jgi:aflatoxin B1 aldehyde reductase
MPGTSETRLGRNKAADRFIIHTKVSSGSPGSHEPSKLEQSIEQSLHDLQTDSVETMYLHLPDRHTPFEAVAQAMNDAIKQGKFKNFGLSNYTAAEVKSFIDICEQNGYVKPSVYHFSPSPAAGGLLSGNASSSRRWQDDVSPPRGILRQV